MLLIRLPEVKSYMLQRRTKRTPTDLLMAEVLVPVQINEPFEFQTSSGSEVFEKFTCQEVAEVYKDGETFYAIKAQGEF